MGNSKIIKEILRDYERERTAASRLYEKRLSEVYEKIPRIAEIDLRISETGIKITKAIIKPGATNEQRQTEIEKFKLENELLLKERKELLEKHKYPASYFINIYKCAECKDTGFIENDKCVCFKQRIINKFYEMSNLSEVIKEENFDTFDFRYYSDKPFFNEKYSPKENVKRIWQICQKFVNNFDSEFTNLFFFGETGLGKTFLCNCIAKDLLDKGKTVLYVTASGLFKKIEEQRFNKSDDDYDKSEMLDLIYTVDLLIIDDLGTEFATIVTSSEFFNIINSRLLEHKAAIISSNLSPGDFENQYSDRITSRILGKYKTLNFYGNDIRIEKKHGIGKM